MTKNGRVALRWVIVACPLLLLGLAAFGQEREQDGERDEQTFRGQVGKVEGRTVTVIQRKDGGEVREEKFTVDERTRIVVAGEEARLEDLREGANVALVHRKNLILRLEVPRRKEVREVVVEGVVKLGEAARIEGGMLRLEVVREDRRAGEERFKLHDDAAVFLGGEERGRLEDLKEGQRVRVALREGTVRRIEVVRVDRRREAEGERPREGDRPREGERPREGDRPREGGADGQARQGEFVRTEGAKIWLMIPREDRRLGEEAFKLHDEAAIFLGGEERVRLQDLKEGQRVRLLLREGTVRRIDLLPVERREADRPREGERPREGDRPREGEGERRRDGERPVVLEPPRKEEPFPVDERIVPKTEKQPDLGGRVVSVFEDGPSTLVTLKGRGAEFPVYLPKGVPLTFVGIEAKEDQKPKAGYVCYIWLKEGSKDTAASARFGLEKAR